MKLIEDTRQQKNKHTNIHQYCKANNIEIISQCLNVGDYMLENGSVSVDTKKDLLELSHDLYQDRKVFNRKYRKSYRSGIKLIVLVEEPIRSINELYRWRNRRTRITGYFLAQMMRDLQISYGIEFYFCEKKDTGKRLIELLTKNYKSG